MSNAPATEPKKSLSDMPREELDALSARLSEEANKVRTMLKAVNKERAFRDNLELKAKAVQGLTAAEFDRLKQHVLGAGAVASGEAVGVPGTK